MNALPVYTNNYCNKQFKGTVNPNTFSYFQNKTICVSKRHAVAKERGSA